MIKTRHGWLFFIFLFIGFQGYAKESAKDTYHKEYFKARIVNSNTENYLVPVIGSTPLRASQVNNAKEKVWNRWIEVNNELEELPEPTHASEANPPLHRWELIDEDPMPFYFIIKGDEAASQKRPLFLNLHGSGPKVLEFRSALGLSKMYDDSPSV